MTIIEPSIEEQQKVEEDRLFKEIENLNKNYKKQNESLKKKNKRSFSYSLFNNLENEIVDENSIYRSHSVFKNSNSINNVLEKEISSAISTAFNSAVVEETSQYLYQNVQNFDFSLKFLMSGDKAVGKTTFLNKISKNDYSKTALPTSSLDIKKAFFQVQEKNVKIEFFDTNVTILNSNMAKSKLFY